MSTVGFWSTVETDVETGVRRLAKRERGREENETRGDPKRGEQVRSWEKSTVLQWILVNAIRELAVEESHEPLGRQKFQHTLAKYGPVWADNSMVLLGLDYDELL